MLHMIPSWARIEPMFSSCLGLFHHLFSYFLLSIFRKGYSSFSCKSFFYQLLFALQSDRYKRGSPFVSVYSVSSTFSTSFHVFKSTHQLLVKLSLIVLSYLLCIHLYLYLYFLLYYKTVQYIVFLHLHCVHYLLGVTVSVSFIEGVIPGYCSLKDCVWFF